MNFPTANLKSKPHLIQPKFGVYKSKIFIPHLNKVLMELVILV